MKKIFKEAFFGIASLAVVGVMMLFGGSIFFGEKASAQLELGSVPTECLDDPSLTWRCIVIGRDEPGIASESMEGDCIDARMLAPFEIDEKGRVMSYVIVGRVMEGCAARQH